ncbi:MULTISPECIES: hypothetical protein [unclassified Pseudomonas]|uniref:phage tail tube protein n=1 Tax=unclassified Pseudomonas TaxID=196821 RepID=UPI000731AF7B|nr:MULTISPECIES: hypothetical protein [unclassified Pseudomonas]KSW22766.1 hypothetical protein AOX63_04930 [Pseudomonas sp. ADP]OBP09712.1 hypothetical protein BAE52_17795 [Pseudomonas sp. EGD-AKN5]QOF85586.1 hypothetical protein IG194_02410 [Pseudomonas sp. ADPe]
MLQRVDRSFIGEGQAMARLFGTQDPLLPLGNCDTFALGFTMDQKKLPNYQGGGGNNNSTSRPSDVTASIGMYDVLASNVAMITRGTVKVAPTAAQPDEPHTSKGVLYELIPFNYLPDLTKPVTVKTAGDVELDEGIDYLLTPHGIQVLSGSNIDETGVKVSYTPRPSKAVHMLNGSAKEYEVFLAGLNDAQSGEPYALRLRRVKFGLLQELPALGQDYMKLTGPCDLLADPTVVANDISKFCQMDLAEAA